MHDEQPSEALTFNVPKGRRDLVWSVGVKGGMIVVAAHNSDAPAAVPGPAILFRALDLHGTSRLLAVAPALALSCRLVGFAALHARHVVSAIHARRVAVGRRIDGQSVALCQCPLLEILMQVLEAGIKPLLRRSKHRPWSWCSHGAKCVTKPLLADYSDPRRVQ